MNLDKITTPDELLAALRGGNSQALEIALVPGRGVPVRLLSAREEALIVAKAKQKAMKENLSGLPNEIFESYETMIAILREATSIDGEVGIPHDALTQMTQVELSHLFDQYMSLNRTINPNLQTMSSEEIDQLVGAIREKKTRVNDCYSWQLAAVGRFCLEAMLKQPMVSGLGL